MAEHASKSRLFEEIVQERYSRRNVLQTAGKLGIGAFLAAALKPGISFAQEMVSNFALTFTEIPKSIDKTHHIAPGYDVRLLMRWGDRLFPDSPAFDPESQSADAQLKQFGYNNDFTAYLPFPLGSGNSSHGLLCVNHEYTVPHLMFPGAKEDAETSPEKIDVEMAAHGHSVLEIRRNGEQWEPVIGSPYNRRISALTTDMAISGPAAGHRRLRTSADSVGKRVRGTFGNCAGGVTPWNTVLISEENFDNYFYGKTEDADEAVRHNRYRVSENQRYDWHRKYSRFDVSKEKYEPNRFGWVVEYDPYDPASTPVKRTALGRFKHETATVALAPDGRVVVYSGDDEKYEYLYRFVSHEKFDSQNRKKNFNLLDHGTLFAAKFDADGTIQWLPLLFGQNGLTPQNGFNDQGDVLIDTRRAADILGATPMDRPEGIAVQPATAQVFVSLSKNPYRKLEEINSANPRAKNIYGHILELLPPKGDHAAERFEWKFFLKAGNPSVESDGAYYAGKVSEHGWLANPDNLAIDREGNLWIATDEQFKSIQKNDGFYAAATTGPEYGIPKLFFTGPSGCEITGPCFTPDGETLFLSVQHPAEEDENSTFDHPSTRWPDFNPASPPRPSVVAITKTGGGRIGS